MIYFTAILLEDESLTSTELLVWYTLCSFAKWQYSGFYQKRKPKVADNVFPSYEAIAERAHLNRATVARALKHLQELGYIKITSGNGRSNHYVLKGVAQSNGCVAQRDRGVAQRDRGVAQSDSNNIYNNINNRIINTQEKSLEEKEEERQMQLREKAMLELERLQKHFEEQNIKITLKENE